MQPKLLAELIASLRICKLHGQCAQSPVQMQVSDKHHTQQVHRAQTQHTLFQKKKNKPKNHYKYQQHLLALLIASRRICKLHVDSVCIISGPNARTMG